MRIAVDLSTCDDHGQCTFVAPQVFSLDENGQLAFRATAADEYRSGDLDEAWRDSVEEAAGMCPVQAIRCIDDER
jgi:ferredoxin